LKQENVDTATIYHNTKHRPPGGKQNYYSTQENSNEGGWLLSN